MLIQSIMLHWWAPFLRDSSRGNENEAVTRVAHRKSIDMSNILEEMGWISFNSRDQVCPMSAESW